MEIAQKWTLTKILNRAVILSTKHVYSYNKMSCINSKPNLQQGNEDLLEYSINLPLHISFCDPKEIINILIKQAESREPIEWIYHSEYKGDYVISEVEETIENQINNIVISAQVTFNLIEVPADKEFKEQEEGKANLDKYEQYSQNSNKFKDFLKTTSDSIKQNAIEALNEPTLSDNLSQRAQEIFATIKTGVISDITNNNVINLFDNLNSITDRLTTDKTLDFSELEELKEAVNSLPSVFLDSALRS